MLSDDFVKTILDPIHGPILLSIDELAVINHRLFRRLHRVRQNGLLYYVFPAATHTRWEHSLGALHVADAIVSALWKNSTVAARKTPPAVRTLESAELLQAIDMSGLEPSTLSMVRTSARMAALVHDLGHGPLSHTFDKFALRVKDIKPLLESAHELASIRSVLETLGDTGERVKHEIVSCVLFAVIAHDLGFDADVARDVAAIILGKPQISNNASLAEFLPLLSDIVASAPADADRMDYLERDSRSLGVSYGLYDRNRLLKSVLAYRSRDEQGRNVMRLGFKSSGLRAVENFIQARFELFVQIYYHKTNQAINLMLEEIADLASKSAPIFTWQSLPALINTYLDLSDERFLYVLRGRDPVWSCNNPQVNALAEDLAERRLWKRVYEGPDCDMMFRKLREMFPAYPLHHDDRTNPKAAKDLDKGAAILFRGADGAYRAKEGVSWIEESPIVGALAVREKKICRVYLKSSDNGQRKQLRVRAFELGGQNGD